MPSEFASSENPVIPKNALARKNFLPSCLRARKPLNEHPVITPRITNGSPPLPRFLGAALLRRYAAEMGPATRNTLPRNAASLVHLPPAFLGLPAICFIAIMRYLHHVMCLEWVVAHFLRVVARYGWSLMAWLLVAKVGVLQ